MTYDNEIIIRHAYHTAEGSVLDIAGFVGSFAEDGVINLGHAGLEYSGVGQESYRGEQLGELVHRIAKLFPDVHAIRLAGQAAIADVTATLDIAPRMPHVFQAYYRILDEATAALDRAGQFLSAHLASVHLGIVNERSST